MWAADARDGYHGGASLTRWVTDDAEAAAVTAELAPHCDRVRIMPFLDGIATSVHGLVLPDGVVALRPVELVTLRHGHELRYAGCATFWDPPAAVREQMREAARRVGEQLRAEVDFRGAFTLDGVATADGFRPTELNPRFGAGLNVITRGLADVPLHLVLDLVVAGIAAADRCRRAGGRDPRLGRRLARRRHAGRSACRRGSRSTTARSATSTGTGAGPPTASRPTPRSSAGPGFARVDFDPARTPVGPSVGQRAADFWRFADAELGTAVGPLEAPVDVLAGATSVPRGSRSR